MVPSRPRYEHVVYTQASQLRDPKRVVMEMSADLLRARGLGWRLFIRELTSRYRQTAFGYVWVALPALVTSLAFILMRGADVVVVAETGIPYPIFVLSGTAFFSLFTELINAPARTISQSKSMLVRVNFPREALILSSVLLSLFGFAVNLLVLMVALLVYGVVPEITVLVAIIPLIGIGLIGLMIGVVLAPIGALFQDVTYGLTIVAFGIMFITPVAYIQPEEGLLARFNELNPLSPLINSTRDLAFSTGGSDLPSVFAIIGVSFVALVFAWLFMKLAMPIVVERLGS